MILLNSKRYMETDNAEKSEIDFSIIFSQSDIKYDYEKCLINTLPNTLYFDNENYSGRPTNETKDTKKKTTTKIPKRLNAENTTFFCSKQTPEKPKNKMKEKNGRSEE